MIKRLSLYIKTPLSFLDAGVVALMLHSTAGGKFVLSDGCRVWVARRSEAVHPIRANFYENDKIWCVSKDTLKSVKSPVLQEVIKAILRHNQESRRIRDASSNKKIK